MKRLAKAAIITELRDLLEAEGSWAGETHLQKALYFLQEAERVPLEYEFILYKHGPFSFDLRDDLQGFRADGLVALVPQPYPYGPKLRTTEAGKTLQSRFPKTLGRYSEQIRKVANFIGSRGVTDLEKLATALMFINEYPGASDDEVAERIVEVKPHVERGQALDAARKVRKFLMGSLV